MRRLESAGHVASLPAWLMALLGLCLGLPPRAEASKSALLAEQVPSTSTAQIDTVFTEPTLVVKADRINPELILRSLPGQASWIDLTALEGQLTNAADVLDALPGVDIQRYGGIGGTATVSIRGSTPAQVSLYLDGVPLRRAGLGVIDIATIPFAALDHIEVYRGFAPAALLGSGMGGAINLITRQSKTAPQTPGFKMGETSILAGVGSFATKRWGFSQRATWNAWRGLLVIDFMNTAGDFKFEDDNGTDQNPLDDEITRRRNNWSRSEEVLFKVDRLFSSGTNLHLSNQWVQRHQGISGITNFQSDNARAASASNLANAMIEWPPLLGSRVHLQSRLFFDWSQDTFKDLRSEIGLGEQNNRDVTTTWGAHLGSDSYLPWNQILSFQLEGRRERFLPWRGLPEERHVPAQSRNIMQSALQHQVLLWPGQITLFSSLHSTYEEDAFQGELMTVDSQEPIRRFHEPRLGGRFALGQGLTIKTSYGKYHRSPDFLELFGDSGHVSGSSDLLAEEGTNRDYGLEWSQDFEHGRVYLAAAHFKNHANHYIVFIKQSQNTSVAQNIGSARLAGEEYSWQASAKLGSIAWRLAGHLTRQRTRDLGTDSVIYTDKTLPGRPGTKLYNKFRIDRKSVGWDYIHEHLAQNYLDRINWNVVEKRDIHNTNLHISWQQLVLHFGLHNIFDNRLVDVSGFPVPGRTFSMSSSVRW